MSDQVDLTIERTRRVLRMFGVGQNMTAEQWAEDMDYALDHLQELPEYKIPADSVIPSREHCAQDHLAYMAVQRLVVLRTARKAEIPDVLRERAAQIAELPEPRRRKKKGIGQWKSPHARWTVGCAIHVVHEALTREFVGHIPIYKDSDPHGTVIEVVRLALEDEGIRGLDAQNLYTCYHEYQDSLGK